MSDINVYDNIDYLLNIYYDLVYRAKPEKNYIFEPITRKNIELIDLKKPKDFDYSNIFDADLKYIGYYNERYHFKRKSNIGFPCQMSFGYYQTVNTSDMNRGVLYNMAIMYIVSEIVINEKFKHSVLPIMLFDIYQKDNKIPDFSQYNKEIKNPHYKDNADNMMYCLITEHYFDMLTLNEYLFSNFDKMTILDWKILFFQVLYSLYKLTERLDNFRHNWLNLNAIRIYTKNKNINDIADDSSINNVYKIGSVKFDVPNGNFDIKITDYDYATTNDYIQNISIGKPKQNDYYDVHYFFNSLYLWEQDNKKKFPQEIKAFIKRIVPDSVMVKDSDLFDGLDESIIEYNNFASHDTLPSMILRKNNFFDDFIIKEDNMNMSARPLKKKIL